MKNWKTIWTICWAAQSWRQGSETPSQRPKWWRPLSGRLAKTIARASSANCECQTSIAAVGRELLMTRESAALSVGKSSTARTIRHYDLHPLENDDGIPFFCGLLFDRPCPSHPQCTFWDNILNLGAVPIAAVALPGKAVADTTPGV